MPEPTQPLSEQKLPRHVAIVMDGNGRWAKSRNRPRIFGHKAGMEAVRATIKKCIDRGVEVLTLFAFSSENWHRPKEEVSLLMELFMTALDREVKKLHKSNARLKIIGDRAAFSDKLQNRITEAETLTADNSGMTLVIAANYGGRWDIAQAAAALAQKVQAGEIQPAAITPELMSQHVCLADFPEPDLFIRTSGEQRISNFLLWQLAYTELYFTDVFWPDFDEQALDQAFLAFANRQRRFGKTGEQTEQELAQC
jgi:undecaprenyl diphosphate synthase